MQKEVNLLDGSTDRAEGDSEVEGHRLSPFVGDLSSEVVLVVLCQVGEAFEAIWVLSEESSPLELG